MLRIAFTRLANRGRTKGEVRPTTIRGVYSLRRVRRKLPNFKKRDVVPKRYGVLLFLYVYDTYYMLCVLLYNLKISELRQNGIDISLEELLKMYK